jgi:hypothetical protein
VIEELKDEVGRGQGISGIAVASKSWTLKSPFIFDPFQIRVPFPEVVVVSKSVWAKQKSKSDSCQELHFGRAHFSVLQKSIVIDRFIWKSVC